MRHLTKKMHFAQGSYGVLDMKQSLWFQSDFSQNGTVTGAKLDGQNWEKSHIHLIYLNFELKDYVLPMIFNNRTR